MVFSSFLIKNRKGLLHSIILSSTSFSGKKVKKIIDEGLVSVNGIKVRKRNISVSLKDSVEFSLSENFFQPVRNINILYEDESFLVVNKPPFINTNKDKPNLEEVLRERFGFVYAVHRLDKQTSGAVIFAKNKDVLNKMVSLFKNKQVRKIYKTVVCGRFPKFKKILFKLDGREAVSIVKPKEMFENATFITVEIETGRKHQIRKHLSIAGFPVVGEFLYWERTYPFLLRFVPRILLHSERILFKSPISGNEIDVNAPLLKDFEDFLDVLRRGRKSLPLKEYT